MSQQSEVPADRDQGLPSAADSTTTEGTFATARRNAKPVSWRLIPAAAGSVMLLTVAVVWVMGPGAVWMLHQIDGVYGLTGKDKAAALDAIRGRLITIATGILGIVAVYYTARNAHVARRAQQHSEDVAHRAQEAARLSHDLAVRTAERTAELTEQGQVTERYTKAIEQLGSENLHIRIGGIYALERIARDSARDHPTVIDVLAAFVRERSHDTDAHAHAAAGGEDSLDADTVGRLRPDLQAAVTVISRRDTTRDTDAVNLKTACLQHATLARADLSGADLREADLSGADLSEADLSGADLGEADLSGADLSDADLSGVALSRAKLSNALLSRTKLTRARLMYANLSEADLTGADLYGAHLDDADVSNADLIGANLSSTNLARANLSVTDLTGADLSSASLARANLSEASLYGAKLYNANLSGANLSGADLSEADVSDANLSDVVGADMLLARGKPRVPPPPLDPPQ